MTSTTIQNLKHLRSSTELYEKNLERCVHFPYIKRFSFLLQKSFDHIFYLCNAISSTHAIENVWFWSLLSKLCSLLWVRRCILRCKVSWTSRLKNKKDRATHAQNKLTHFFLLLFMRHCRWHLVVSVDCIPPNPKYVYWQYETILLLTTIAIGAAYGTSKAGIGIAGIGSFKPELVMKVREAHAFITKY